MTSVVSGALIKNHCPGEIMRTNFGRGARAYDCSTYLSDWRITIVTYLLRLGLICQCGHARNCRAE